MQGQGIGMGPVTCTSGMYAPLQARARHRDGNGHLHLGNVCSNALPLLEQGRGAPGVRRIL
jgi:hypothetical protein